MWPRDVVSEYRESRSVSTLRADEPAEERGEAGHAGDDPEDAGVGIQDLHLVRAVAQAHDDPAGATEVPGVEGAVETVLPARQRAVVVPAQLDSSDPGRSRAVVAVLRRHHGHARHQD